MRPARTVSELLQERADSTPARRFVTCGDAVRTFGELNRRVDQVASALQKVGVTPGDRVAVLLRNRIEMVELYFALARAGAVQVPINAFLKGEFLRYQLNDSGASVLLTDAAGHAAVTELQAPPNALTTIIRIDRTEEENRNGVKVIGYHARVEGAGPPEAVEVEASALAAIMYTSGTTGYPKGCMLSHAYYLQSGAQVIKAAVLRADDSIFCVMPLFHAAAQFMVISPALILGIPAIIEPEFNPKRFFHRARETGATVTFSVGAIANALLATEPSDTDRDHGIRQFQSVPLAPDLQMKLEERFGVQAWSELFGQTECLPALFNRPDGERKRHTVGRASDLLEVALLDDQDRQVGTGQIGEICLRPRHPGVMFDGYWGKPEDTLRAFSNLWYHTGDLGKADEFGHVTFADRKKDCLRRRGENVSSIELEFAIMTHPNVAEVAVHAVPAGANEDEIKACIVAKPGGEIDPESLFEHFKKHLPYFAIPRYVELLPELPRNAMGRVMKYRLAEHSLGDKVWDFKELGFVMSRSDRR
jgi:carnitine-CoA ligase